MRIDERDEHPPALGRELQAAGDLVGEQRAGLLVVAGVRGLADIVQQNRKVENRGVLEFLENGAVAVETPFLGEQNGVEFFDANEGVLVSRVAVVEFVLHEAIERAELGDVAAEHAEVVHEPEDATDLAFARKDREEGFPRGGRVLKSAVDEVQAARDEIDQLGMELELTDLGVMEGAQEAVGIVVENLAGLGNQLAVAGEEAIELFGLGAGVEEAEKARWRRRGAGLHFSESSLGDEKDGSRVAVVVAHERLHLPEDVFLRVIESLRHTALELEGQLVRRAPVEILHLGAGAQQEVVAFIEAFAVSIAEDFGLHKLGGGANAELELGDPQKALVIPETAGAIFDVRLLHENALTVFGPHLGLIGQTPGDVFLLTATNAFLEETFFESVENIPIAGEEARLEHGGFGDHVLIGFLNRLGNRAGRLPDFEADIPEGDDGAADDFLGLLVAGIPVLKKKHIDVAHGREFAPPIAAEGRYTKSPGEWLRGHLAHDTLEKLAHEDIHDVRPLTRDFPPSAAGGVPITQTLLLDLEEILEERDGGALLAASFFRKLDGGGFQDLRFGRNAHGASSRITISTRRLIFCSSIEPVSGAIRRFFPRPMVLIDSGGIPIISINQILTESARSRLSVRLYSSVPKESECPSITKCAAGLRFNSWPSFSKLAKAPGWRRWSSYSKSTSPGSRMGAVSVVGGPVRARSSSRFVNPELPAGEASEARNSRSGSFVAGLETTGMSRVSSLTSRSSTGTRLLEGVVASDFGRSGSWGFSFTIT